MIALGWKSALGMESTCTESALGTLCQRAHARAHTRTRARAQCTLELSTSKEGGEIKDPGGRGSDIKGGNFPTCTLVKLNCYKKKRLIAPRGQCEIVQQVISLGEN